MSCGPCSSCGKKMKAQGGQCTCMNPSCPQYLEPKEPTKYESPIAQELAGEK